ncbi:MAG: ACP S-malonyltransferase [Actinomycetota bacterium]
MLAFTFPGQGSQREGMGRPWTDHPSWELVEEASEASGRDVAELLLDADAETLRSTENAQLTTYVLSMVVLDAVTRVGIDASVAAGHSLGEYSALTAAGTLDFVDGIRLVDERGRAMRSAADQQAGTMAAVLGLEDERVEAACSRVVGDVWAANYNAPGQVVIAGDPDAIDEAGAIAKELGAKRSMALPVGGAFHTPFMAPARDALAKALSEVELRAPSIPVVANVDALAHDSDEEWRGLLAAQLCSPVRWRQSLRTLSEMGVSTLVELGPGNALTGMAKRAVPDVRRVAISTPADVDALLQQLADDQPKVARPENEGEHLFVTERLVVATAAGIFRLAEGIESGASIGVGQPVGTINGDEVRSPFAGSVMGVMAVDGERVAPSQPIAWLRTS